MFQDMWPTYEGQQLSKEGGTTNRHAYACDGEQEDYN